jgi:hypothetical protein
MHRKPSFLTAAFLLISCLAFSQPLRLFTEIHTDTIPVIANSKFLSSFTAIARVDALLSADNFRFIVDLPGTDTVTIRKMRQEVKGPKKMTWYGVVEGSPGSVVILTVNKTIIEGRIIFPDNQTYLIRYRGNQKHTVGLINKLYNIGTDEIIRHDSTILTVVTGLPPCNDPPNIIDILVLYTDAAADEANGTDPLVVDADYDPIRTTIENHIDNSNVSFINSNVNLRYRLIMNRIDYTEDIIQTDLTNLASGTIPDVQRMRQDNHADIVIMVIRGTSICGMASDNSTLTYPHPDNAFAVVRYECLSFQRYTLTHESGHILLARHDWDSDRTDNAPFRFNHGNIFSYTEGGNTIQTATMMGAIPSGSSNLSRQLHWSNPVVSYPVGSPTGTVTGDATKNNALTLELTKAYVAAFRCASPPVERVWMRDTYNDRGLEPDPNTADEAMHRSPYIWVRNSQDDIAGTPAYPNQHLHENPIAGRNNWVYVKMHNNGPAISGRLQVYYASASTRLDWPTDWTLVRDTALNLAANSTEIVEIPWMTPNISGHYCMVARWVASEDPMGFVESRDIDFNTRRSNNIIWRNMNFIDMSSVMMMEASFLVQQQNPGHPLTLIFSDAAQFPKFPFIESGTITIIPDSIFVKAWKIGGNKSKGIKYDGLKFIVVENNAQLKNIILPKKYKARFRIIFEKNKATQKDKFEFRINHFEKKRDKLQLKGGIAYEISTNIRPPYK